MRNKKHFPPLSFFGGVGEIKATLSAINIFTPADSEEKNAPFTDAARQAACADLLKKRPLWLADPTLLPNASPLFAVFPPYMSQYSLRKRRMGRQKKMRVVLSSCRGVGGSVPCWRCSSGGTGGGCRHLPDCRNVNATALIIGFCTHRL